MTDVPRFPGTDDGKIAKKWQSNFSNGGFSSMILTDLEIKSRVVLIDDWCRANDLGFIFAARGLGKTWLAMHLAHGMATRHDVGPWKIHGESRVLYVDGEMAAVDIKFRDHALGEPTENLVYINHELLFERTGAIMNLADYSFQEGLLAYCIEERFTVLFLDNLSTLASGIDENKSIDWEIIQPWLLRLRRAGITVIFVHHAGRNNQMRGVSKREDPASWIIRLDPVSEEEEARPGAHFISRFTKWRGTSNQPKCYEWAYVPHKDGEILVTTSESDQLTTFLKLVTDGIESNKDLAQLMDVSEGRISQLASHAERRGWIKRVKGKYRIDEP